MISPILSEERANDLYLEKRIMENNEYLVNINYIDIIGRTGEGSITTKRNIINSCVGLLIIISIITWFCKRFITTVKE